MSTTQNTPDTWENRIEQSAKILGITPQRLEEILRSKGYEITKEDNGIEMLSDETVTPFGDFRKLFCEDNEIALPKLRLAMKYLRGTTSPSATSTSTLETIDPDIMELQRRYGVNVKLKLDDLGAEELIPLYKPNKNNKITEVLRKKYGSKNIVAFKPDTNEIATEETINYLADLEQGYNEEETIEVDGELVKLYPIGTIPNQMVDEDPLYVGFPLKRERSTLNRINWQGIPIETRQFFRVLVSRKEIDPENRYDNNQLIKNKIEELKNIFPEAYMEFKEMKKNGDLPKLQMSLTEAAAKKNNPFGINRSY